MSVAHPAAPSFSRGWRSMFPQVQPPSKLNVRFPKLHVQICQNKRGVG